MKRTFALLITSLLLASTAFAQTDYNAVVTPTFGSDNPTTNWNATTENGFFLALRAKERFVTPVMNHTNEVYYMPVGTASANRSDANIELSARNLAGPIGQVDVYLKIDIDPSAGISYGTANVLTTWNDNSYGDETTANGAGFDGTALQYAGIYNTVQLSQNRGFDEFAALGAVNPAAPSTYDYVLYVVEKGAGPNGTPLASIAIQVVTGGGGATIDQLIAAIDTTGMNHGDYVNAVKALARYLFDGGVTNNKESAALVARAAKSSIGN
jgi:hypothetical protein